NYFTATAGLTISLANSTINTGDGAGDVYISIENLAGTRFDDRIVGDINNNSLRGNFGADTLDGGGGFNTAAYFNSSAGLTVDLTNPSNNTGEAVGDVYISIQALSGSRFTDFLRGDANNNLLDGSDGDDVVQGLAGADTLRGGTGFDRASYANM